LVFNALQHLIGGQGAGRVYVFGALFLCGFAAMTLLSHHSWWIQCTAGVLAMLNPFVYDRLVEGQWGVVAATAGLFLFIVAWWRLGEQPGPVSAAGVIAAGLFTLMFSADFAGILLILAIGLASFNSKWRVSRFRRWAIASYAGVLLLSLFGVIPFFIGHGPGTYQAVSAFSGADFAAFQSTPSPGLGGFGVLPALLGLYGEWSERLFRYPVADIEFSWWVLPSTFLVLLAIIGAFVAPRRAWLILVGAIGVVISASTATPAGQRAATALASHFPLLGAYREPQKWDSLWLIALVVLGSEAIAWFGGWLRVQRGGVRTGGLLLAALTAAAAIIPAGAVAAGSTATIVAPVEYPSGWYQAAAYMTVAISPDDPVAVLPWHLYEALPFIGRQTNDPATVFFPGNLLSSQSAELPGEPPDGPVGAASSAANSCALATALRSLGARWALVLGNLPDGPAALSTLERCGFTVRYAADDVSLVYDPLR
jgi:hypothetical protein